MTTSNRPLPPDANIASVGAGLTDTDDINVFLAQGGVRLLRLMCIVMLLASVIASIETSADGVRVPTGAGIAILMVICLTLLYGRRIRAAVSLFMWGLLSITLIAAALFSGLSGQVLILMPVLATSGAILLGTRQGWLMSAVAIAGVGVLSVMSQYQLLPKPLAYTPSSYALIYVAAICLGAILGINATASFRRQYRQALALSASLKEQVDDLRRSEEQFSELFRANPLPSVTGNALGIVTDVNDAWLKAFGYKREDVVNRESSALGHWADPSERDDVVREVQQRREIESRPVTLISASGEARRFLLSVAVIKSKAGERFVSQLLDQTDRLAAEEAQRVLNIELESRVEERTAELQQTLAKLKGAQEELIHAETLASLGSMVAGISHELNTPIGNTLTVATTLQQRVDDMNAIVQAGALKRSALDTFFADTTEMSELIVRSATRAASLIGSFKQVAIDQTSERRREYQLHGVTEDILSTLRPTLKRSPWVVENRVSEGLLCDGFPGPLGQILTNLVQNAAVHAFEGRDAGMISIAAELVGTDVLLTVTDDGNGMDAGTLAHVFDPFFTTKLGQGGSGLGLSICHRIASSVLGGELKVRSSPGSGSCFTLRFPRVAPGRIG